MAYNNPIVVTYTLKAVTISTAATLFTAKGPSGLVGRVVDISAAVTTQTTTAATEISVGSVADQDKFAQISVAAAAVGTTYNGATLFDTDANLMPADTEFVIYTDGGCDAGAADIAVTIAWF